MKRKILSMLLIFGLILVFGACGQSYEDDGNPEPYFEEEIEESEDVGSTGMDLLAWEPNEENNENFFLLRDEVNYSLGSIDPEKAVGVIPVTGEGTRSHGGCSIYSGLLTTLPAPMCDGFFSYGDVPVPTFEQGDKIVSYSSTAVPDLQLRKVNFYGDAIRLYIVSGENGRCSIIDDNQGCSFSLSDNVDILNQSGDSLDSIFDVYNLNEGEYYAITWYEGTQYEEENLPADSKFYVPERGRLDEPEYSVSGTLTKSGYAEYDISTVEPGIYAIVSSNDNIYQGLIAIE